MSDFSQSSSISLRSPLPDASLFARLRCVGRTVHRRRGVNRHSAQRVPHETGQPNGGQTVSWALFRVATDS